MIIFSMIPRIMQGDSNKRILFCYFDLSIFVSYFYVVLNYALKIWIFVIEQERNSKI